MKKKKKKTCRFSFKVNLLSFSISWLPRQEVDVPKIGGCIPSLANLVLVCGSAAYLLACQLTNTIWLNAWSQTLFTFSSVR